MLMYHIKPSRENLEILVKDINAQKRILKEEGLTVDGTHYSLRFTGMSSVDHYLYIGGLASSPCRLRRVITGAHLHTQIM